MSSITAAELRPGEVVIGAIREHDAGTVCPNCGDTVSWLDHEPVIATGEVICTREAEPASEAAPLGIFTERDLAILQLARVTLQRAEHRTGILAGAVQAPAGASYWLGRVADSLEAAEDAVFDALNTAAHVGGGASDALAGLELGKRWGTDDSSLPRHRPFARDLPAPAGDDDDGPFARTALVNLDTGAEATAIGSAIVPGWTRLEHVGGGKFRAPDGSLWLGCSDGVWRRDVAATLALVTDEPA